MAAPKLERYESCGVTLLGDSSRPCGVTLAFAERTGGVSEGEYASLNVGKSTEMAQPEIRENVRRLLAALGAEDLEGSLIRPRQIHTADVVRVRDSSARELSNARVRSTAGADIVVCTATDVPVLLCSADCVILVLVCEGGFAVAHSGWPGTMERVAEVALRELCDATGASPDEVLCYLGPHIRVEDFEVSEELADRFVEAFGPEAAPAYRHVSLEFCIRKTLQECGMPADNVVSAGVSTASNTDRYFSYRAEGGVCGRLGTMVVRRS